MSAPRLDPSRRKAAPTAKQNPDRMFATKNVFPNSSPLHGGFIFASQRCRNLSHGRTESFTLTRTADRTMAEPCPRAAEWIGGRSRELGTAAPDGDGGPRARGAGRR